MTSANGHEPRKAQDFRSLHPAAKLVLLLILVTAVAFCLPVASWLLAHAVLPVWRWGFGAWS